MEKKKKQLIFIIIMVPIMGFLIYNNLIVGPSKKKAKARKHREAQAAVSQPAAAPVARKNIIVETAGKIPPRDGKLIQIQDNIAKEPWGRDPFNPAPTPVEIISKAGDYKDFKLTGIIPGPTGGAAIINSEVIGAGEEYRGYRLIKVESSQITLEKSGQTYILSIPEE